MHKITSRPFKPEDFEYDNICVGKEQLDRIVKRLNDLLELYNLVKTDEKLKNMKYQTPEVIWKQLIEELPQSYKQKRTVMMSYAALRNIYRQRKGHKLSEWAMFREWCESLPESWMITE